MHHGALEAMVDMIEMAVCTVDRLQNINGHLQTENA